MGQPRQKHKACQRYEIPGHAHHLTFSCFHGLPLLSKDRSRQWLIESIEEARRRWSLDVWAYVIMPEHCHLLIHPRVAPYNISEILWTLKAPIAQKAKAYLTKNAPDFLNRMLDRQPSGKVSFRFWQRGGGYDGNVIEPTAVHNMIEYIHANPIRRGLVTTAEEWRWSSAQFYAGFTDVPLMMNRDSLPTLYL